MIRGEPSVKILYKKYKYNLPGQVGPFTIQYISTYLIF